MRNLTVAIHAPFANAPTPLIFRLCQAALKLDVQQFDWGLRCMGKCYEQLSLSERVYIQAQSEFGFKAAASARAWQ